MFFSHSFRLFFSCSVQCNFQKSIYNHKYTEFLLRVVVNVLTIDASHRRQYQSLLCGILLADPCLDISPIYYPIVDHERNKTVSLCLLCDLAEITGEDSKCD
jgi:hypothetical protein